MSLETPDISVIVAIGRRKTHQGNEVAYIRDVHADLQATVRQRPRAQRIVHVRASAHNLVRLSLCGCCCCSDA